MPESGPSLHICVTCQAGQAGDAPVIPPGQALHDAVMRLLPPGSGLRVLPVRCLASCDRGCTAAIGQAGKWRYLLGGLDAGHAADLITYAEAYAASRNGTVLPSRRPATLQTAILGRFPAEEISA